MGKPPSLTLPARLVPFSISTRISYETGKRAGAQRVMTMSSYSDVFSIEHDRGHHEDILAGDIVRFYHGPGVATAELENWRKQFEEKGDPARPAEGSATNLPDLKYHMGPAFSVRPRQPPIPIISLYAGQSGNALSAA